MITSDFNHQGSHVRLSFDPASEFDCIHITRTMHDDVDITTSISTREFKADEFGLYGKSFLSYIQSMKLAA